MLSHTGWSELAVDTSNMTASSRPCRSLGDVILALTDGMEDPNHGPNTNVHLVGYFLDREP